MREYGDTRKKNAKTAMVLISIAMAFFLGIILKYWLR